MNFNGFITVLWSEEEGLPVYVFSNEGKVILKGNSTDNSDFRSFAEGFATALDIRTKFIKITKEEQLEPFESLLDAVDVEKFSAGLED